MRTKALSRCTLLLAAMACIPGLAACPAPRAADAAGPSREGDAAPAPIAAAPAPLETAPAPTAAAPAPSPPRASTFRATTAMRMDGAVVAETLVREVNRQIESIARCADLVRQADGVVGSLNLEIDIAKEGAVPHLRSPVSPAAERCILDGMRTWSLVTAGHGRAMVLLTLEDAASPTMSGAAPSAAGLECRAKGSTGPIALALTWDRDMAKGTLTTSKDGKPVARPVIAQLYKGLVLVDAPGTKNLTGALATLSTEGKKTIRLGDHKQPAFDCE